MTALKCVSLKMEEKEKKKHKKARNVYFDEI